MSTTESPQAPPPAPAAPPDARPGSAFPPQTLFGANVPMARALGLIGEAIGAGYARIRLPYVPDFTNSRLDVHGGALLTLLDCTLACAARGHDPAQTTVITVDLSTHFIAGATSDVIGEARCLRRGRSLAFSQGELRDPQGNLLATATATLKLIERRAPTAGGAGAAGPR